MRRDTRTDGPLPFRVFVGDDEVTHRCVAYDSEAGWADCYRISPWAASTMSGPIMAFVRDEQQNYVVERLIGDIRLQHPHSGKWERRP